MYISFQTEMLSGQGRGVLQMQFLQQVIVYYGSLYFDKSTTNVLQNCLKYLDIKWAVKLHSDSLKICYFDSRGGVILHYLAEFHFKKTHETSEVV